MAPLLDRYQVETLKNTPLVFYRMREGSGTTMLDYSTNAINGTYNGSGITWTPVAAASAITGFSKQFSAASGATAPLFNSYITTTTSSTVPVFDGVAGRATATLTGISTAAASSVTVEMWVKWDGNLAGANGTFEALANFGGATGLLLGFLKNGASDYRFGLSVRNTGDLWGLSNVTTVAALSKDMYHHIVFVIVNNNVQASKLYIDGTLYTMTQQIGTSTTTDSVTTAFAIGYDGTASFFQGGISEVAVYNTEKFNATAILNRFHVGAYGGDFGEDATIPGVESMIELAPVFQALPTVLNYKPNGVRLLDQYYVDEIAGLDDAEYRTSEESNFYRDGMNPLITRLGGRTVVLTGYINASNIKRMRQLQSDLKGTFQYTQSGGFVEFPLIFRNVWDNGFDFSLLAKRGAPLQMKESQSSYVPRRDFQLSMRASSPYLESVGVRTEIIQFGASLASAPNKGNAPALPLIKLWGPMNPNSVVVCNSSMIISSTLLISTFLQIDAKSRSAIPWTVWNAGNDFPSILPYPQINNISFISILGATAGVTRMEISWRHTVI